MQKWVVRSSFELTQTLSLTKSLRFNLFSILKSKTSINKNRFCVEITNGIAIKCFPCNQFLNLAAVFYISPLCIFKEYMFQGVHEWLLHGSIEYSWKDSSPFINWENTHWGFTSQFGLHQPWSYGGEELNYKSHYVPASLRPSGNSL